MAQKRSNKTRSDRKYKRAGRVPCPPNTCGSLTCTVCRSPWNNRSNRELKAAA